MSPVASATTTEVAALDIDAVRADFPILHQTVNGHPLAFLDSAASAQRPRVVLDTIRHYYEHDHANVHRGVHTLSQCATERYEHARETMRAFVGASSVREIVFVRGTTEAINLVAQSYARPRLSPGDEILVTRMEHHSNIVPWQLVCEQTGATLKAAPIDMRGSLLADEMIAMMGPRTRMVALGHVSNALGTINPVADIVQAARQRGIATLVDGAQAAPHLPIDVAQLGCDFYALSGHKMYGPTGIGILYGREKLLEDMPPWQGGGEMILEVRFEGSVYNEIPAKFEAGTPNIAGAIGLGAAADYLNATGLRAIAAHEHALLDYATAALTGIDGLTLIGTAPDKASVVSFVLDGIHPHDIGTIADSRGVAIRTGHHCAMPVMDFFAVPATARASFGMYNTCSEIDALVDALQEARRVFG